MRFGETERTSVLSGQGEWSGTSTASEKCQLTATPIASAASRASPAATSRRQRRRNHVASPISPTVATLLRSNSLIHLPMSER